MKPLVASVAILGVAIAIPAATHHGSAAEPTFAKDVAPVVFKNCTTCHRPGGLGPFSLLDPDTAAAHSDEILEAVKTGYMPPWHAEGPHDVFKNDRRLSQTEKDIIINWAKSGAKKGNMKDMPAAPVYPSKWVVGTPDAIVSMPEDFHVPSNGTIEYQYFEVPTGFTEDKWVQAIEFMPGAREVVHHIIVYAKVPPQPRPEGAAAPAPAPVPAGTPAPRPVFVANRAWSMTPREIRKDTIHPPPRQLGTIIGATAPGTNVMEFPEGTALRLRAGTIITFQMHYTAKGHEMMDRSQVGFKFAKEAPEVEIGMSQFINGAFTIPAGAKDVSIPAEIGVNEPVRIYGLLPHTHLRGTRWKYELVKADSSREVILDVPHYDFNWQTYYFFKNPLIMPAGSKIVSTAWYDNSASNKHNPDASIDVKWGDQTWEEMQYTAFLYSIPSRDRKKAAGTQH
jgi:mono/diheme cytochrome c family protein